jgi:hypothetical protein
MKEDIENWIREYIDLRQEDAFSLRQREARENI